MVRPYEGFLRVMADDIFLISKLVTFSINVLVHLWLLNYFLHNQYLTLRVHVRLAMPWNDLIGLSSHGARNH
jgi:hypothetical protein